MKAADYERRCLQCQIGVKAFQNVTASVTGFARLIELESARDHVLLASVFYWSVTRYSKPFLDSSTESGYVKYPVRHLKKVKGFAMKMHNHLLHVRNTMIAHDDFDEIAPRILTFGLCFDKRGIGFVPTSIVISNKCLSFPVHPSIVKEMQSHAQAALQGIHAKLQEDVSLLRKTIIKNPGVAIDKAKYTKNYGRAGIPAQKAPEFSNDEWLNAKVPNYSSVHGGFVYEETRIMSNFHGPETITLPDGHTVEISPNQR